jgi:hypothetical protein
MLVFRAAVNGCQLARSFERQITRPGYASKLEKVMK